MAKNKDLFWAGIAIGKQRKEKEKEKEMNNSSGTRAPEVQREIELAEAFSLGYQEGTGVGVGAHMLAVSEKNLVRGYGSNVTLNITYSVGVWYLELTDASSRKVTAAHEELGRALEEIFQ